MIQSPQDECIAACQSGEEIFFKPSWAQDWQFLWRDGYPLRVSKRVGNFLSMGMCRLFLGRVLIANSSQGHLNRFRRNGETVALSTEAQMEARLTIWPTHRIFEGWIWLGQVSCSMCWMMVQRTRTKERLEANWSRAYG